MSEFSYRSAILKELRKSRLASFADNHDHSQLGDEPPLKPTLLDECLDATRGRLKEANGLGEKVRALRPLARALAYYAAPDSYFKRYAAEQIASGELLYGLLADEPSRALLVKLIAYRVLGYRKVKLPRNNPGYWADIERVSTHRTATEPVQIKFLDAKLAEFDLNPLGFNVKCHASPPGLACAVVQKQYEYHHGDVHCKAEAGDVVIDGGGCWGETSLYFAHEAGPTGAVVAFEFIPSNLEVMKRKRALNPHLIDHLHLIEKPIWSESGLKLYYVDWGPGSRVTDDINKYHSWEGMVETITIDQALSDLSLAKVDFIKMDIEGAELDALKGAEQSIRKHRPKLAISLYHKPDDFETIPGYLHGLGLGYRFYLDHHTIYQNETVLFAVPAR